MDNSSSTTRRKRGLETPERDGQKRAKTEAAAAPDAPPMSEEAKAPVVNAEATVESSCGLSAPIRIAGPPAWSPPKVLMAFPRSPPLKSAVTNKVAWPTPWKVVAKVPCTPSRVTTTKTPQLKSTPSTASASGAKDD